MAGAEHLAIRRGAADNFPGVDTKAAIDLATDHLRTLRGHVLDVLTIARPTSSAAAVNLAKIVSKLSPLLGNLIEFSVVESLNTLPQFSGLGQWKRQDPGFPDAIFDGTISPTPGLEIKAWFPLATEITGRFKGSQAALQDDETHVAIVAWLPDSLIYGSPQIVDVCVVSGLSVAMARDEHYHDPPDYLVIEPGDTSARTGNLQQTTTAGYKWQGDSHMLRLAEASVASWGKDGRAYSPSKAYQERIEGLRSRFPYRLDTNYAKIDRIDHAGIEAFKAQVLATTRHGATLKQWSRTLSGTDDATIETALKRQLKI